MSSALDKFTQDLLGRVGEGLAGLLASEIRFTPGQLSGFTADSLKPFGDEFVAVLTAAVTEPYAGTIYTAFDLKRVVILGALLEMVPPEGIKERLIAPTFSADHADAFEEVGNILIGKLDEVIRNHAGQAKIHTKKGDTLHGPPAEVLAAIQGHGDYYCLAATVEIAGQEAGPVVFLLPPPLVEEGFQADPEVTRWRVATRVAQGDDAPPDDPAIAQSAGGPATDHAANRPGAGAAAAGEDGTQATPRRGGTGEVEANGGGITTPAAPDPAGGAAGAIAQATVRGEDETFGGDGAAEVTAAELLAQTMAGEVMATARTTSRRTALCDPPAPRTDRHDRTVLLVVDDDITTRAMIRHHLEGPEISIFEAVSWREAGLFLRSHRVDAILLDLYLSDLNGIDACRKLHLHPSTRCVPVVLCTSRPSREAVLKGLKAGAADFLIKPFSRDKLIEKLDTVLHAEPAAAA